MYPDRLLQYDIVGGPFSGTYGSVWIGKHDVLGRKVALKRLHSHVVADLIEEEALKLHAVKSPHVVQIHDFIKSEPTWGDVLLLEFCPMGLDEYLVSRFAETDGSLPYDEARALLEGILRGLNDAHDAGIVHGDIKPANVRFGVGADEAQPGLPKLSDFGAARRLREAEPTIRGSTNWIAPELLEGHDADQTSDFFSYGILAYLILSARHPFFADDPSCLTSEEDNIRDPQFPLQTLSSVRPDIPPRVAELIDQLLSREPDFRASAVTALKAELSEAWYPAEAVPPELPSPPGQPAPEELAALAAAYERARRQFFVEYRPAWAVDTLTTLFDELNWKRFKGQGVTPLADCWSLMGFIKNSSGRFGEAVEAATNGLAIESEHLSSLHVRGYANIQLGDYEQARTDLERALELATGDANKQRQITALLYTIRERELVDESGETS